MNAMAPTRPFRAADLPRPAQPRDRLAAKPSFVPTSRAAIFAWDVPVVHERRKRTAHQRTVVTNAIRHETNETITLAITGSCR